MAMTMCDVGKAQTDVKQVPTLPAPVGDKSVVEESFIQKPINIDGDNERCVNASRVCMWADAVDCEPDYSHQTGGLVSTPLFDTDDCTDAGIIRSHASEAFNEQPIKQQINVLKKRMKNMRRQSAKPLDVQLYSKLETQVSELERRL